MKRHIWFPYLDGTRCICCERPKITEYVLTPCPGRPPEEPVPAEPAPPGPGPLRIPVDQDEPQLA